MKTSLFFAAVCWIGAVHCYKYLFVALQAKSHMAEQVFVAEELASRGHDVYMAVAEVFPLSQTMIDRAGIKLLRARKDEGVFRSSLFSDELDSKMNDIFQSDSNPTQVLYLLNDLATNDCSTMIEDNNLMQTIKKHEFDLAIVDAIPFAPCSAMIPYHLGIPFVSMFSNQIPGSRLPVIPSFVPFPYGTFSDKMSFSERLKNLLAHAYSTFVLLPSLNRDTSLLQQYPAPSGIPATSWDDLQAKSRLFIMTRDYILERPIPTMPYYIMLPGITQQLAKTLPPDLNTFMTSAKRGVILVSFGSGFSRHDQRLINQILSAFRALPELSFLFKMSDTEQKLQRGVPGNVRFVDWMPQNDVLGHEATKGFITHCGNNGQYESVYHGVPMIGLPLFADQHHNCFRMADKGVGVCLDTKLFTVQDLIKAINRITSEASFRRNVKIMSSIMKEAELPSVRAAHWIEHVTKYGAEHLLSSSIDMPWYQYWLVDVAMLLVVLVFVAVYALLKMLKCVKWFFCNRKRKSKDE